MPKKTRKAKMRAASRPITANYAPRPAAMESARDMSAPRSVAVAASTSPRASAQVSFNYEYVYKDLRRIALLAVLFFGVMLVIWALIQYTTVLKPFGF